MKFNETKLKGSYLISLEPYSDDRGLFTRTFCKREFEEHGLLSEFVQFNHSINNAVGTLRGMHFQIPPFTDAKLIRCISGAVYDVIIDLRHGSNTFLQWVGIELSSINMLMIYVPEGFAHGFVTLTNNTELLYHHTQYYTPGSDCGLRFDDSRINIEWPQVINKISEKDKNFPLLDATFKGVTLN